ncbi:cupin domain-containing protein [Roseomonas sp. CCTCC AB2023176]|uniref:cupin domain-containing protein n=1 Tax=Roseomonas sp. CCTCC AB2023176 TaxID=3342640 RepID=UPI0035E27B3C
MSITSRLVRYADLIPCKNAFVDTRTPGSDAKENFSLIGPGVSENPNQHVHIPEPHGFNIGAARQPGGCLNSQHSHETAEVFVVHSGHWAITFGAEAGADGEVEVAPGDVYSVPTQMFRGFRKLDEGVGFLWVALGRDDPGRVQWAPKVFDLARQYGLVLLKGGRLVDTTVGETVPPGAELEEAPNAELVRRLATPSADKLASCAVRLADMRGNPRSPLAGPGVEECPVITPAETRDGFAPGPITGWWPHGFNLRLLRVETGARIPPHVRDEEEVIFVHRGTLEVTVDGEAVDMAAGDTFTTPKGATRSFRALSSDGVLAYVVRGGDQAGAVRFVGQRAAAE